MIKRGTATFVLCIFKLFLFFITKDNNHSKTKLNRRKNYNKAGIYYILLNSVFYSFFYKPPSYLEKGGLGVEWIWFAPGEGIQMETPLEKIWFIFSTTSCY